MRVCVIPAGTGGVAFYRVNQPYSYLQKKGYDVFIFNQLLHDSHRLHAEQMAADIIVFQCPWSEGILNAVQLIKSGKSFGKNKKVVIEFDDNLFDVSPWNEKYNMFGIKEFKVGYYDKKTQDTILRNLSPTDKREFKEDGQLQIDLWQDGRAGFNISENIKKYNATAEVCRIADLLTVTTSELGSQMRKYRPEGPIAVLPNLIDFDRWLPMKENKTEFLRIGWQGGSAHFEDLHLVSDQLIRLAKKYPQIKYVFMGQPYPSLFEEISDRVEWHGWHGDISTYPLVVRDLALDVGICPLVDNVFNWGKSPLKWEEYSAMIIPSVVSPVVYSRVVKDGKTALIAKDDEWFSKLEKLVVDENYRHKISKRAYNVVKEKYSVDHSLKWWSALENLMRSSLLVAA